MNEKEINSLKERYSTLTDEELKKIIEVDCAEYLSDAVSLVQLELKNRGINCNHPVLKENDHSVDHSPPLKTSTKILLRCLLFPVWLVMSGIVMAVFGAMRPGIKEALIWLLKNVGVSDLATLAAISGLGMTFFWFLLGLIYYLSFKFLIDMTK